MGINTIQVIVTQMSGKIYNALFDQLAFFCFELGERIGRGYQALERENVDACLLREVDVLDDDRSIGSLRLQMNISNKSGFDRRLAVPSTEGL